MSALNTIIETKSTHFGGCYRNPCSVLRGYFEGVLVDGVITCIGRSETWVTALSFCYVIYQILYGIFIFINCILDIFLCRGSCGAVAQSCKFTLDAYSFNLYLGNELFNVFFFSLRPRDKVRRCVECCYRTGNVISIAYVHTRSFYLYFLTFLFLYQYHVNIFI